VPPRWPGNGRTEVRSTAGSPGLRSAAANAPATGGGTEMTALSRCIGACAGTDTFGPASPFRRKPPTATIIGAIITGITTTETTTTTRAGKVDSHLAGASLWRHQAGWPCRAVYPGASTQLDGLFRQRLLDQAGTARVSVWPTRAPVWLAASQSLSVSSGTRPVSCTAAAKPAARASMRASSPADRRHPLSPSLTE
jgi:hypothetical protein